MSLFVITKTNFEYNDEIYHRPESEGGSPVIACSSEDKANEYCDKQNMKMFLSEWSDLNRYFYTPDEIFSKHAVELLEKHGVYKTVKSGHREYQEWQAGGNSWQAIPPEDMKTIFDGFKLKFFEVYEVEDQTNKK